MCRGTPRLGRQRRVTCLGVGREGGLERERFGGKDKAKVRMLSAFYEKMQTQNRVKGCRTQSGLVSAIFGTLQETFSQRYSFHLHGVATAKQKCQKAKLQMATMVDAPSLWQPEDEGHGQGCWLESSWRIKEGTQGPQSQGPEGEPAQWDLLRLLPPEDQNGDLWEESPSLVCAISAAEPEMEVKPPVQWAVTRPYTLL